MKKNFLKIFLVIAYLCLTPLLHAEEITIKSHPGNPWWYNSELVFSRGKEEITHQRTDTYGNLTPTFGRVPDGPAKGYDDHGELMAEIIFKNNLANGLAHSYYNKSLMQDTSYRDGKIEGI